MQPVLSFIYPNMDILVLSLLSVDSSSALKDNCSCALKKVELTIAQLLGNWRFPVQYHTVHIDLYFDKNVASFCCPSLGAVFNIILFTNIAASLCS